MVPCRHPRPRDAVVAARHYYHKKVVLLGPNCYTVPRGKVRAQLHDSHQIANMVEFDVNWSEGEVIHKIEEVFK